jgi:TrmH family RNA methyltransferase
MFEAITSLKNPNVQMVKRLQVNAKLRKESAEFVVEGVRLIEEVIKAGWGVRNLLYTDTLPERGKVIIESFQNTSTNINLVSSQVMKAMSDTKSPSGILAVVKKATLPFPEVIDFLLILDQIRDPGNLGTILRTAAAAGVQAVLTIQGTVDAFSPKVIRSGMGAQFRIPIQDKTWGEVSSKIKQLQLQVLLALPKGEKSYFESDYRQPLALVIGGEADGASADAIRIADLRIRIPMPGEIESLNAAIAAGILLFEIVRQREKSI